MNKFTKFKSLNKEIDDLQNNIDKSLSPLLKDIYLEGNIITSIKLLANQDNVINHQLQRRLTGWEIVRKKSFADICDNQDRNKTPELTLILRTTDDVTIDIRVF